MLRRGRSEALTSLRPRRFVRLVPTMLAPKRPGLESNQPPRCPFETTSVETESCSPSEPGQCPDPQNRVWARGRRAEPAGGRDRGAKRKRAGALCGVRPFRCAPQLLSEDTLGAGLLRAAVGLRRIADRFARKGRRCRTVAGWASAAEDGLLKQPAMVIRPHDDRSQYRPQLRAQCRTRSRMCPALVKPPERRKIQLQIVTVENKVNARTRVRHRPGSCQGGPAQERRPPLAHRRVRSRGRRPRALRGCSLHELGAGTQIGLFVVI